MLAGGPITWRSPRQKSVALSTTEAEYVAVCEGVKEAVWLRKVMKDIFKETVKCTTIFVDNQSAITLSRSQSFHKRLKHIDIRRCYLTEICERGVVRLEYVNTANQLADMFTKPLSRDKFKTNVCKLGMKTVCSE